MAPLSPSAAEAPPPPAPPAAAAAAAAMREAGGGSPAAGGGARAVENDVGPPSWGGRGLVLPHGGVLTPPAMNGLRRVLALLS